MNWRSVWRKSVMAKMKEKKEESGSKENNQREASKKESDNIMRCKAKSSASKMAYQRRWRGDDGRAVMQQRRGINGNIMAVMAAKKSVIKEKKIYQ